MKKQTAVEWLYSEWSRNGTIFIEDLEQAKEMEREQIIESFDEAISISGEWSYTDGEKYYNETYSK